MARTEPEPAVEHRVGQRPEDHARCRRARSAGRRPAAARAAGWPPTAARRAGCAGVGEPVDHPAGEPEQPQLLGGRRLDREVVGVVRVPVRGAHLARCCGPARPRSRAAASGSHPSRRAARAAPTRRSRRARPPTRRPDSSSTRPLAMKSIAMTSGGPCHPEVEVAGHRRGRRPARCSPGAPCPAGSRTPTISRSFSQSAVAAPRIALTACCTGVSTCRATKTTPTKVSGPAAPHRRARRRRAPRSTTASSAGIARAQQEQHPPRGRQPRRRAEQHPEERRRRPCDAAAVSEHQNRTDMNVPTSVNRPAR